MSEELIVVEDVNALQVFTGGGLDPLLSQIREKAKDLAEADVETEKGRKVIASAAYKVARSKTALDSVGKALVQDWKDKARAVDVERKRIRDELDALKAEIRKPLDEWEEKEAARLRALKEKAEWFSSMSYRMHGQETAAELKEILAEVKARKVTEEYGEYEAMAHRAKGQLVESLEDSILKAEKKEAQAAEEARKREQQVQEEHERAQRAERERAEKAEAEKRRLEKEQADRERQEREEAERKRKAEEDRENRRKIHREIVEDVIQATEVTEEVAKEIVRAIVSGEVRNLSVSYYREV